MILGVLGYLALTSGKAKTIPILVVSILLALLTAFEFADVLSSDEAGVDVSIGIGLWLVGAGAVAALVASVRLKKAS